MRRPLQSSVTHGTRCICSIVPLKRPRVLSRPPTPGSTIDSNEKATATRSGRGQTGGSAMGGKFDDIERDHTGLPPRKVTSGGPSSDTSVNASEIMQNMIMNDDDKEHYAKLSRSIGPSARMKQAARRANSKFSFNSDIPHGFDVGLNCSKEIQGQTLGESNTMSQCLGCAVGLCRTHISEGKHRKKDRESLDRDDDKLLIEPDKPVKGKKPKKEVNAVAAGGVSGYTLPLGKSNKGKRQQRKRARISARAFGGGKVMD